MLNHIKIIMIILVIPVESFLRWFARATGDESGKGYKSSAERAKEISSAAQNEIGDLQQGCSDDEEATEEVTWC